MVQFPNEDISEPPISSEPEIPIESTHKIENPNQESPQPPNHIKENKPDQIQHPIEKSNLRFYVHQYLAKPVIGPPEPGHTTFTLTLQDQTVNGFYQPNTDTRSLKELAPIFTNKLKTFAQNIKNRDFKKDIKTLKTLPTTIKKGVSKINVDSIKNIPKKLRSMFSSD